MQFLTENSDFIVVGVIGPPGVGKSTIMNELYGYDGASVGNPEKKLFFFYESLELFPHFSFIYHICRDKYHPYQDRMKLGNC